MKIKERKIIFLLIYFIKTVIFSKQQLAPIIVNRNNQLMRNYTGLDFNKVGKSSHRVILENDIDISREVFLEKINTKIQQLRFKYSREEFEKIIITTIFAFRGSQDFNRMFYTVDILKDNMSEKYINNLASILLSLDDLKQLNINFRELQPEYLAGISRNTQLRINLKWFYDNYLESLYQVNIFKADILLDNDKLIATGNYSPSLAKGFIERLYFYKERIVEKKSFMQSLSKESLDKEVQKLREDLEFKYDNVENNKELRNSNLVKMANATLPNECVACKDIYDIEDRTFYIRDSNRPYLEIHHVISFGSDKSGDVLENLVKLCPSCHRALTPKRAKEDYQKEIILNILKNSEPSKEYVKNFVVDPENQNQLINFVYEKLK